ncbi:MAG: hypothetical protein ACK4MD_03865 [Demequina sp.]
MAQLLLLEGLDPSAILQRAHEDYGPGVSVVQAERIRTGGVLGFFARETYALTLEVPDGPGPQVEAGVLMTAELADVERARRELTGSHHAPVRRGADARAASAGAAAFDAALAEVLAGAAEAHGTTDPAARVFAPATFPAVEAARVLTVGSAGDGPAARASADEQRAAGMMLHAWGLQHERVQAVTLGPSVAQLLRLGVPARLLPADARTDTRVPIHEVVAGLAVPRVRRLGPGDVLVVVGEPDAAHRVAMQVAFWARVPAAGVVFAGQCPAVPGHGRRVLTPASAARTRARAEEAGRPLVVSLGTAKGRPGVEVAAGLIAAFGPCATWGALDVSRHDPVREEVLCALTDSARCDAIAAVGLAEAQAPASILDGPLPVAWIDGVPASSVAWAAMLGERVAEADAHESRRGAGGVSGGLAAKR